MSERIRVRTADLRAVADSITASAGSTSRVADALRQLGSPDGHAFGDGSAGLAAHTEYRRVHQDLTHLTNGIGTHLAALGEAVLHAAQSYGAAQARAVEAVRRLS
ncbi:hypothetical protein ACFPC0_24300 [Streptomyces andamanensis]|uniref:ESX-1 secretion-associated protein n=1 Tax=Streptomyces andamanensis TaxID=1565035 RepID=A0ABV8TJG9_9ACTN